MVDKLYKYIFCCRPNMPTTSWLDVVTKSKAAVVMNLRFVVSAFKIISVALL